MNKFLIGRLLKKHLFWFLVTALVFLNLWTTGSLQAQAIFQNNDTSCEEHDIIGEFDSIAGNLFLDSSITCGRFNDDSAVIDPTHGGDPDFPDCATQADAFVESPVSPQLSNSILTNTAAHGDNCINAGGANPQFQTPDFLALQDFEGQRMGNIAHGNLNGGPFDDLAMAEAGLPADVTNSQALGFLFSQTGGGFGSPTDVSGVAQLEPSSPVPYQTFPGSLLISAATMTGHDALMAQSALVLQDCDGDGVDEAMLTVKDVDDSQVIGLIVVQNDGSGLVDNPAPVFIALPSSVVSAADEPLVTALVQGDFIGDDGVPDLIAAIVDANTTTPTRSVVLCQGDGACGFSCPTSPDPNELILPGDFVLFSATSGDFDGDGKEDVALPELGMGGGGGFGAAGQMRYLLNRGGNLDTWDQVVVPLNPPGVDADGLFVVTSGRFTTLAVQNQVDEVVGNGASSTASVSSMNVTLVPTDGMGGFGEPRLLSFSNPLLTPAPLGGVDAADFDHCGGDDVMSIAQGFDPPAVQAVLFLNENEAPVVTIGPNPPTEILLNSPTNIPTTCTDPTLDDRTFQWSVVNQPIGATVVFGTPTGSLTGAQDDASTTFEANQVGAYTIQVTCTDFCGLSDDNLDQIQINFDVVFPLTQGDNLFHCNLSHGGAESVRPLVLMIWLSTFAFIVLWRIQARRHNP